MQRKKPTFLNCVVTFPLQARSRTSVRCAGRPSVRAPTSSRTAGNTRDSNPSAATCAGKASRGKWTCGDTRRRSTDSNEQNPIWFDATPTVYIGLQLIQIHSALHFAVICSGCYYGNKCIYDVCLLIKSV